MDKRCRGVAAIIFSGLFFISLFHIAAAEAAMKSKSTSSFLEDMFKVKRVAYVVAAGDNSKVAYSAYSLQTTGNKKYWQNQLYLKTACGKDAVLAEGADYIYSPLWSFDGQNLAYLTRDKIERHTCIWIFDVAHNSSYRLLAFTHDIIAFKWSPDGQKIAFIAEDIDRNPDRNPGPLIDVSKKIINMRLYMINLRPQEQPEVTPLTSADYSVNFGSNNADFDWSTDGRRIAFAYQPRSDFQYASLSKIAIIDLATLKITKLPYTENHTGINPAFSPDGMRLAFATNLAPGTYNQEAFGEILHYRRICVTDLAGDAPPRFLPDTPSESPNIIGWEKDGKGVYVYDFYRTRGAQIYFLSLDSSAGTKLISRFKGRIDPSTLTLNSSRTTLGFAYDTVNDAPEAYVCAANQDSLQLQPISHFTPSPKMPLGQVEIIHWNSPDGQEIEGLLIKPANYDPHRKYPVIVMVHGAPLACAERYLGGCEDYGHQMVDASTCLSAVLDWGFVAFQPNFRGSIAYGKEFQAASVGDWGGKDYQDIMSGVDYLVDRGVVDAGRMVISGWSYGGYMTSFAIGQTDRFKAAIIGAGVTNLISQSGTSDMPELQKKNLGCYFWDNFDLLWQRSAMAHVKNIHTPVLILHGEDDVRVPVSQAYELYQALRLQQKPATMYILPKEGHAPADPNVILATIEAIHDWLIGIPEFAPGTQ